MLCQSEVEGEGVGEGGAGGLWDILTERSIFLTFGVIFEVVG
jgi:hypothetical protein